MAMPPTTPLPSVIKSRPLVKSPFFSPCKINLFLDVLGRRGDGYHDLRTVFLECCLGDSIEADFHTRNDGIRFRVKGPFADETPADETNLFLKAFQVYEQSGRELPSNLSLQLTKAVPPQAGLGGGSSNAATALRLANHFSLESDRLTVEELTQLAARVGSDCPFFVRGGVQYGSGRGEILEPILTRRIPSVVILVPQSRVPTPKAFASLSAACDFGEKSDAHSLMEWFAGSTIPLRDIRLQNAFERSVCEQYPEVKETLHILRSFDPDQALLSGSGSACFALFDGAIPEAVKNTVDELQTDPFFRLAWWEEPSDFELQVGTLR